MHATERGRATWDSRAVADESASTMDRGRRRSGWAGPGWQRGNWERRGVGAPTGGPWPSAQEEAVREEEELGLRSWADARNRPCEKNGGERSFFSKSFSNLF